MIDTRGSFLNFQKSQILKREDLTINFKFLDRFYRFMAFNLNNIYKYIKNLKFLDS